MTFIERPRKKLGAMHALRFQLECVKHYTLGLERIADQSSDFDAWIERERSEIVKSGMRKNYELRFSDKDHPNLYREVNEGSNRVMEHAVPISHWYGLYNTAPRELRAAIFFMGWAGPIANVTKSSDLFFKGTGEVHFNKSIWTPFDRYRRAGFDVLQEHPGASTVGMTLGDHYDRLDTIDFMRPIMVMARQELNFNGALAWVKQTQTIVDKVQEMAEASEAA
jgi:hypothetical protein